MGKGIRRFTDLRAWQACHSYKLAVYRACCEGPIATDWTRRRQLEEAVAGPPANIAEGFGRFSPVDFARFATIARASLLESQNHLLDAVAKGYIDDDQRLHLNAFAEVALKEVSGLTDYLLSTDAVRNARQARERRNQKRVGGQE